MSRREALAANRLLCYAMLLAASYILMRSVGDSLFLARVGSDSLAAVFVASGTATAIIASLWYGITRRFSLSVSITASSLVFAVLTLGAWIALPQLHHSWWLLAAIYLLTEIKGCVNTINVVTAMNDLLGGHSSRQAWARIGLGAPLAGIMVGLLLGIEASFFDLRTWLLFSAILDLAAAIPLAKASRIKLPKNPNRLENSLESSLAEAANKFKIYACSRQFRFWIGTLITAKVVVLTLVAYFWKVSVSDFFSGNEALLTGFFGVFYASIGLLTLLVQVFITGNLISQRSLFVPILFMPVSLVLLGLIVVFSAGALVLMVILTLAKSLEVWRRSVHDTTLNLLYTNIDRKKRRTAIAFNSAIVKPLAEVGASLVLLLGTAAWQQSLVVFALGVWIMAAIALIRLVTQNRKSTSKTPVVAAEKNSTTNSNIEKFVPGLFHH